MSWGVVNPSREAVTCEHRRTRPFASIRITETSSSPLIRWWRIASKVSPSGLSPGKDVLIAGGLCSFICWVTGGLLEVFGHAEKLDLIRE